MKLGKTERKSESGDETWMIVLMSSTPQPVSRVSLSEEEEKTQDLILNDKKT